MFRLQLDGRSAGDLTAPVGHRGAIETARALLIRATDAIGTWQERVDARRRLGGFDDRMLSDIGIDRATAEIESAKPFWRS